jgi:hypothetical protein
VFSFTDTLVEREGVDKVAELQVVEDDHS